MLLFTAAGYFLAVSKTALLLGDTSNRYQLPVYGIVVLLTLLAVKTLWGRVIRESAMNGGKILAFVIRHRGITEKAAVVFCIVMLVLAHWREDVVFLYPEDREQTAYAKQRAAENTPAVYLYQPGEEWCIWDVTNELLEYPEIYFVAIDHAETFVDDKIRHAHSLVVYLPKMEHAKEQLAELCGKNEVLENSQPQYVFAEKYCDVFYVRK